MSQVQVAKNQGINGYLGMYSDSFIIISPPPKQTHKHIPRTYSLTLNRDNVPFLPTMNALVLPLIKSHFCNMSTICLAQY